MYPPNSAMIGNTLLLKASDLALFSRNPDKKSDKTKAREQAQQDVFLREVDEALRQDEMLGLVRRYMKPLIAALVIGLGSFGGYLWWQDWTRQEAERRSEQLVVALDHLEAGRLAEADGRLNPLAGEKGVASAFAAKLLRAGIALEQNRLSQAVALYAEVAADPEAPQAYRDLATVREVAANFDAMTPQAVIDRLKPLAVPGKPWFGAAGELLGIAYLRQGKPELAGPLFASIARDGKLPESLRTRVRQLAGALGVDAMADIVDQSGEKLDADKRSKPEKDAGQPVG
ncbi:MAG: tetratricopeptide repeat protein [Novosphingobium sp.]|nr:tetratricopeptide repeat protein [Novosphingobium sp.]